MKYTVARWFLLLLVMAVVVGCVSLAIYSLFGGTVQILAIGPLIAVCVFVSVLYAFRIPPPPPTRSEDE